MADAQLEQVVSFDITLFSKAAVLKAAYRVSDRLAVEFLEAEPALRCRVRLRSIASQGAEERLASAIDAFRREVLDQQLREQVRSETAHVRDLILAKAFSRTGFVD